MEIGYEVPTSTNFAQYNFFQVPKIVLSGDPLHYAADRIALVSFSEMWLY